MLQPSLGDWLRTSPGLDVGAIDLALSLVIEGDLVTRVDLGYVSALLQLWRQSVQAPPPPPPPSPPSSRGRKALDAKTSTLEGKKCCVLPPSAWCQFGTILVLRDESEAEGGAGRDVWVYEVSQACFQQLLYTSIPTHRMDNYLELVGWVKAGRYNRRGFL